MAQGADNRRKGGALRLPDYDVAGPRLMREPGETVADAARRVGRTMLALGDASLVPIGEGWIAYADRLEPQRGPRGNRLTPPGCLRCDACPHERPRTDGQINPLCASCAKEKARAI